MKINPNNFSVMVLDAGFQYSSEDISQSLYRAFERVCGSENVYRFRTKSGFDFSQRVLTTYNIFNNKGIPDHKDIVQLLCDPILRYAILTQVDLIIAVHGLNINTEVIDCLRMACPNTRTACWVVDDPQQIDISKGYASHYDYVFTNEQNTVNIHGKNRCWYLPTAFDDEIFKYEKVDDGYKSDILISGSIYPDRYEFIEEIYNYIKDYDIKVVGRIVQEGVKFTQKSLRARYNGEIIPQHELAKYMFGAKICLDIPRKSDVSEYGRTNRENISASYCNPRIFETASVGSLILTSSSRESIKKHFDEDNYLTYNNSKDCINKIIYYLKNSVGRQKISEKAYLKVWKEHRYIDRVESIIKYLPDKPLNTRLIGLNLSSEIQNDVAKNKFKDIWQKNLNDNVEFSDIGTLDEFNDFGKGRTALIISNAPSLEDNVDVLQQLYIDKHLKDIDIFTVNSAYKELRKKYIVPKFHVQIHPTEDQDKHFKGLDNEGTIFLASALLDNKVIHAWAGNKIKLFLPLGTLDIGLKIPKEYKNKLALVESVLVVGFTVTAIAIHFRYEKIIFLGLDFSFVHNRKYAFQKCNFDEEIRTGFIVRKDVNNAPVITDYTMLNACDYLIALTNGQKNVQFYNSSKAGLLYGERIKQISLQDFNKDQFDKTKGS